MAKRLDGTVLYGMMGCGKTTLGLGLARHLGQPLTDTDTLIERYTERTCAEIIADPTADFAKLQAAAILKYRPTKPEVIPTGGSVAMYPAITGHLALFGVGVFIDVDPDTLEARLSPERIAALNNPEGLSFGDLYRKRRGLYVKVSRLILPVPPGESADESLERLIDLRARAA